MSTENILSDLKQLHPAEQRAVFKELIEAPETKEKEEMAKTATSAAGLGPPSPKTTDALWYIVMSILAVVIIGGGILAVVNAGSDEAALYGLVGLALGAVVGLLATPGTSK